MMATIIRPDFLQSSEKDVERVLDELFNVIHFSPLDEPNAYRTQLARIFAGNVSTPAMLDFVAAMENPLPIVSRLRAEGVKSEDVHVPFITMLIAATNDRPGWGSGPT